MAQDTWGNGGSNGADDQNLPKAPICDPEDSVGFGSE